MNDKQFFNKIGLECEHSSEFCCLECEAKIDNNGCPEDCEAFQFPEITADHIIALEGLIKWPYSFGLKVENDGVDIYTKYQTYNIFQLAKDNSGFFSQKNIIFFSAKTRKEALKDLISWMIDENILTKEEVKAVFE